VIDYTAVGVPIKLIHEAEGHVVTIELKNGEIYRGLLQEAEDTMNCKLNEGIVFLNLSYCLLYVYYSNSVMLTECFMQ
jgi:hypothetical protein